MQYLKVRLNVVFLTAFIYLFLSETVFSNVDTIQQPPQKILTLNPYQNVDWVSFYAFKANLHTHTQVSDGFYKPHEAVDLYHQANYKILSITDHVPDWSGNNVANISTWPWEGFAYLSSVTQWNTSWENRNPNTLGMLAVQGSEASNGHHRGSFFNGLSDPNDNLNYTFQAITQLGGLSMLYHPGRYWDAYENYTPGDWYSLEWYENFFTNYSVLLGLEVYNQGNRYPYDRILWDELLMRMMPDRPIWGYSNDDMHSSNDLFRNYNFMFMDTLDEPALRKSMVGGASYFCYEPGGSGNALAPTIDSIIVDRINHTIALYASNYDSIQWISGVAGMGVNRIHHVVDTSSVFSWSNFDSSYVRAVLINTLGRTYTQPFGFDFHVPEQADTIFGLVEICLGTDTVDFYISEDIFAETYFWQLPPQALLIGTSNSNRISVDFSNVTASGEILVWKKNISGYSDTTALYINITSPTFGGTVAGSDTLCAGDVASPLTLSGHNGVVVNWQHSSDQIMWTDINFSDEVLVPGIVFNDTYFRAIVKKDGCSEIYSDTAFIKAYPVPYKPVVTLVDTLLLSSSPSGNRWYDQQGEIAGAVLQYYAPLSDGSYYVMVTSNNCTSEPSGFFYYVTGINDVEKLDFSVFPNPVQDKFTVKFNDNFSNFHLSIYDITGVLMKEQVFNTSVNNHEIVIDVSHFAEGLYMLKIQNESESIIHRVIIMK